MTEYREGFIERWSGKLLRWLMAYLFLMGIGLVLSGVLLLDIGGIALGVPATIPYLIIRYRDPDCRTIPLLDRIERARTNRRAQ